jgi:hypothetical protein
MIAILKKLAEWNHDQGKDRDHRRELFLSSLSECPAGLNQPVQSTVLPIHHRSAQPQ